MDPFSRSRLGPNAPPPAVQPAPVPPAGDAAPPANRSPPSIPIARVKIISNFSTRALCELVDKFTDEQRSIAATVGLGFVLHLPRGYRVDRVRAVWLLANLFARDGGLVFAGGAGGPVPVRREDVEETIGVHGGTIDVLRMSGAVFGARRRHRIGSYIVYGGGKVSASVNKAEEIVASLAGREGPMTSPQRAAFVAALMVLAVGSFLAPKGINGGEVDLAVMEALRRGLIGSYDWPGYVLSKLADAADDVRSQIRRGCPDGKLVLSGCLLMVQYFYYRSCVCYPGVALASVSGRPLMYCFTGGELKAIDRVDQFERRGSASWNVLTCREQLDGALFLEMVTQLANSGAPQADTGTSYAANRGVRSGGETSGGSALGAGAANAWGPLFDEGEIPALVHKHVLDMVHRITTELVVKHGHLFGGVQTCLFGDDQLANFVFSAISEQIGVLKTVWLGNLADGDSTPQIDPLVAGVEGNNNTRYTTPTRAQGPVIDISGYRSTETHGTARSKEEERGKSVMGAGVALQFSGISTIHTHGSARSKEAEKGKSPIGSQLNENTLPFMGDAKDDCPSGVSRLNKQGGTGWVGGPVYDISPDGKHSELRALGSSGQDRGMNTLVGATGIGRSLVERKRVPDGFILCRQRQGEKSVSGVDAGTSDGGLKKRKLWLKPFEAMEAMFSEGDGMVEWMRDLFLADEVDDRTKNKIWVKFGWPVDIEIGGEDFLSYLAGGEPYSLEFMGAIMARYKELDDKIHKNDGGPRWRFFVDPRLTGGLAEGIIGQELGELRYLVGKPYNQFDAADCEMGIVPVLYAGSWCCIAIHMIQQKVTCFQPTKEGSPGFIKEEDFRKLAEKVVRHTLELVGAASGAEFEPACLWAYDFFKWRGADAAGGTDQPGLMVALFSFFFDGIAVRCDLEKEVAAVDFGVRATKAMKWSLCYLMLARDGNPTPVHDILIGA